jgi:hypothetical protein
LSTPGAAAATADGAGDHLRRLAVYRPAQPTPARASSRRATASSRRTAKDGALDFAQLHEEWADKLARTLGIPLASVAPSVWHDGGDAAARTRGPEPSEALELARAAQKALALVQQERAPGPAPT